jgi:histone H3/H4
MSSREDEEGSSHMDQKIPRQTVKRIEKETHA